LNFQKSPEYATGLMRLTSELTRLLPGHQPGLFSLDALMAYEQRANTLTTLFYGCGLADDLIGPVIYYVDLTHRGAAI